MSTILSVRALLEEGVPKKTIACRLGIDPRTVRHYARRLREGEDPSRRARVPGKLDGHRARIEEMARRGMRAVQIFQDLRDEGVAEVSYTTVRRLVRSLRPREPEVFCRLSFRPGEEGQVDFGEVGRMRTEVGMRRVWLFALTLCHSRYAYYDLVLDQTVPTFLGALRRAFEFFGGAPRRTRPDNLRAAVLFNQLGERYYQEDFYRFCRHYGTLPDAARPATPTDKGRCERDIGYVKGSCFRGRDFADVEEARAYLARWRDGIANVRLHGTTQRRPCDLFEEERAHLAPLPADPYEICEWGIHVVRKDCHFALRHNHYSVPWRLAGSPVLVRLSPETVAAFAGGEQVALHARAAGRGETVTDPAHYPPRKRVATQEIHRRRLLAVRDAGPHAAEYLSRLSDGRYVKADQVARLARLVDEHGPAEVDLACRRALHFRATGASAIVERILAQGLQRRPWPEASPGPSAGNDFPRPMREYGVLLAGRWGR